MAEKFFLFTLKSACVVTKAGKSLWVPVVCFIID